MTTIWRLNIKTDADEGVDPRMFCIDRNILGIGWPVDSPVDADTPLERVQAVDDQTVSFYSRLKYNRLSKEAAYNLPGDVKRDLFALIWPEDCEDIV